MSDPSEQKWKVGSEFAPFHPEASHCPPDYRDGWNHCFAHATTALSEAAAKIDNLNMFLGIAESSKTACEAQLAAAESRIDELEAGARRLCNLIAQFREIGQEEWGPWLAEVDAALSQEPKEQS